MRKLWMSDFNLRAHLGDALLKVTIVAAMTLFTLVPLFTAMAEEGRSYWDASDNANEKRSAVYKSYGHYEDEYERVNGEWKFSYREVVYENRDGRAI